MWSRSSSSPLPQDTRPFKWRLSRATWGSIVFTSRVGQLGEDLRENSKIDEVGIYLDSGRRRCVFVALPAIFRPHMACQERAFMSWEKRVCRPLKFNGRPKKKKEAFTRNLIWIAIIIIIICRFRTKKKRKQFYARILWHINFNCVCECNCLRLRAAPCIRLESTVILFPFAPASEGEWRLNNEPAGAIRPEKMNELCIYQRELKRTEPSERPLPLSMVSQSVNFGSRGTEMLKLHTERRLPAQMMAIMMRLWVLQWKLKGCVHERGVG